MARQMVINYGMSDIGPWSLMDPSAQQGDFLMRMMARNSMSENLQERIDENVKQISMRGYEVSLRVGSGMHGAQPRTSCRMVAAACFLCVLFCRSSYTAVGKSPVCPA